MVRKKQNKVIRFNYSTFVSAVCNFLTFELYSFLPPASKNTNKQHAVTQMGSSAVMWHIRELFSNSGSGKEEEREKMLQLGQFSLSGLWRPANSTSAGLWKQLRLLSAHSRMRGGGVDWLGESLLRPPHKCSNDCTSLTSLVLEQTCPMSQKKLTKK